MSYSLVHSLIAFFLLVALIFSSIAGVLQFVLNWGRLSVDFLSYPFVEILTNVRGFLEVVISLRDLSRQNEILSNQVEQLTAEVALLEKAKHENETLREALNFQNQTKLDLTPAEVIAWDQFNPDETVTINRGKDSGIREGDSVVVAGNILVGTITKVFEGTSQFQIITSSSVVVNAETPEGKATGVVRGEHGLGMLFDLISQSETIKSGDKVITSGLGGLYPPNLLIGAIAEIRTGESELFQKASVVPATNLRNLRYVFVSKK